MIYKWCVVPKAVHSAARGDAAAQEGAGGAGLHGGHAEGPFSTIHEVSLPALLLADFHLH